MAVFDVIKNPPAVQTILNRKNARIRPVCVEGTRCLQVPLTRGLCCLIDESDIDAIRQTCWTAKRTTGGWYAHGLLGRGTSGKWCYVAMHELLLRIDDGINVDHINGNGIDNRRCNLRPCSQQENCMNRIRRCDSSSQYKGVGWYPKYSKWFAKIQCGDAKEFLGYFASEVDAAVAYDSAARRLFGEFARLNFPARRGRAWEIPATAY
jgi:hypothetical protein